MTVRKRVVIDTNALVSRLLLPKSVPAQAVQKAAREADMLMSEATLNELADVLARPKFNPYVSIEERQEFIRLLGRIVEIVPVVYAVHECRDSKDNKLLEVAVNGEAEMIVSGSDCDTNQVLGDEVRTEKNDNPYYTGTKVSLCT